MAPEQDIERHHHSAQESVNRLLLSPITLLPYPTLEKAYAIRLITNHGMSITFVAQWMAHNHGVPPRINQA